MQKTARVAFPNLDADKREEAVANVIALCWKFWHRLGERGRADEAGLLKSVCWFAIKQVKSFRTVCTAAKPRCPMTLRAWGKVSFEPGNLEDFVGWTTPVLDAVSFRIDIPRFLNTLSQRQKNLALDLAGGMTTSEAATKYNRTPGAISQLRTRFKVLLDRFFAE